MAAAQPPEHGGTQVTVDFEDPAPRSANDTGATVDAPSESLTERTFRRLGESGLLAVFGETRVREALAAVVNGQTEPLHDAECMERLVDRLVAMRVCTRSLAEALLRDPVPALSFGESRFIVRELGGGAFAKVFLIGEQRESLPPRLHVGKLLRMPSKDADAHGATILTRFEREYDILASLDGSVTPRVTERGERDGHRYFLMEYHPGYSLEQLREAAAPGAFPLPLVRTLGVELALRLHHLHGRGVVHRDIKPGNILHGDDGQLRFIDFGLAAEASVGAGGSGTRLTQSHQVMGTPDYLAPEQIETPLLVDERTDDYSLGGVLYHLASGRRPFIADTVHGMVRKHSDPHLKPDFSRIPDRSLAEILEAMLQKDRAKRLPTLAAARALWPGSSLESRYGDFNAYVDLPAEKRSLFPSARSSGETTVPSAFENPAAMYGALTAEWRTDLGAPTDRIVGRRTVSVALAATTLLLTAGGTLFWWLRRGGNEGDAPRVPEPKATPTPEKKTSQPPYAVRLRGNRFDSLALPQLELPHGDGVHALEDGMWRGSYFWLVPSQVAALLRLPSPEHAAKFQGMKDGTPLYVHSCLIDGRRFSVVFLSNIGWMTLDDGKAEFYRNPAMIRDVRATVGGAFPNPRNYLELFRDARAAALYENFPSAEELTLERGAQVIDGTSGMLADDRGLADAQLLHRIAMQAQNCGRKTREESKH